ncbi:hypothetical protein OEZ85_014371 [Tetradesmus obliquus]|uniref:Pyruvate kinase n=1 Tax=Tetradesmus obliquus TaxID=3088 RepID=A0ABY8U7X0_TETOB|nr:hypothetical protein OEZ85_014371 [Tetradesmus obliquus]
MAIVTISPAAEQEIQRALLAENGFRSTRRTKLVCTIGPSSCSYEVLSELAQNGMNVARLNMTHGNHEWHNAVVARIRQLNKEKGYCIAIMADTEGSEIHTGELEEAIKVEVGTRVYFTIRSPAPPELGGVPVVGVNYDSLGEDLEVGDHIIVDGGMCELVVVSKAGPDVLAESIEQGLLLSKANLTFRRDGELIRGRAALLPVISAKDWRDIDWAISAQVDFIAVSFVRTADVITNLRSYIETRTAPAAGASGSSSAAEEPPCIELIAKLEAYDCLAHLDEIIRAADGIMVARGDLGAQIPVEEVPSVQKFAVSRARQLGKPAIVAHQLLHSMIGYPIPTRAEVADVADVVRQRADALMLSGESAMGAYPLKALGVLRGVAGRMEEWARDEKYGAVVLPQIGESSDGAISEEICASAALMANRLGAAAIFVFTRRGYMANFLSRCRPDCPVFAFTDSQSVRQRLNLRWGIMPFRMPFFPDPEENVRRTFQLMRSRGFVQQGQLVVVVSDLRPGKEDIIRSVQASGWLYVQQGQLVVVVSDLRPGKGDIIRKVRRVQWKMPSLVPYMTIMILG